MYKHIIIFLPFLITLVGCPGESSDGSKQNDSADEMDTGINTDGLPVGTECNNSGICTYECTAEDCHNGVDLNGGIMITANCCYMSGEDEVCQNTSWYIRGSDGFVVADCNEDEICQLIFQI